LQSRSSGSRTSSAPTGSGGASRPKAGGQKKAQRKRRLEEAGDLRPGFLGRATVTDVTRQRYEDAAAGFAAFAEQRLPDLSLKELDAKMTAYMEQLFLSGEAAVVARYAFHGVCFALQLNTRDQQVMPKSRRALKGYSKKAPEHARDPPPLELVFLLVDYLLMVVRGFLGAVAAALVLVATDCYLRPSEAVGLQCGDVFSRVVEGRRRWSITVAPICRETPAKNLQFDDGVLVGGPGREKWGAVLDVLLAKRPANAQVFEGINLPLLERLFRDFSRAENLKVIPHGLRHCGASHDAFHDVSLVQVQQRGRWLCLESCRRYSKPSKLLRALSRMNYDQLERAKRLKGQLLQRVVQQLESHLPRHAAPKRGRAGDRSVGRAARRSTGVSG